MTEYPKPLKYPRRVFIRALLQNIGRLLVSLLFNVKVTGKEKFPTRGPVIVVGNHSAIMETVLLICYAPWQIEMLGAADIPHEKVSQIFSDLFGFIPVNRGHVDRPALRSALGILDQHGVLGIFPEGGIWEPGLMRAQTGVAWLSYRGNAPVIPIGFSGTLGAIDKALKLRRPKLVMKIGDTIPPLNMKTGIPRKTLFEDYSEYVMVKVRDLLLPDEPSIQEKIKDERFELKYSAWDGDRQVRIPNDLSIKNGGALAKFLHRPAILKIFRSNLKFPIEPLERINSENDPNAIAVSLKYILNYLEDENPYLLTYRFGPKTGEEMKLGLKELLALSNWGIQRNISLKFTPIRRFYSLENGKEIVQTKQGYFAHWM
jgi:1-acyl-sn-glycerol-3-phosphate acyltransferase